MTPKEFAKSLRIHVEHAADLADLPEEKRAAFWRILEWNAGQDLEYVIQDVILAERERAITAVIRVANDLPAAASIDYYEGFKAAMRLAIAAIRAG